MNNNPQEEKKIHRKLYIKPQIEKVHMRTNETMNLKCFTSSVQINPWMNNYCAPPIGTCLEPRG